MSRFWHLLLVCGMWTGSPFVGLCQTKVSVKAPTGLPSEKSETTGRESARVESPKSLTFTASTDQRFFFFNDTRNDNGRRVPVSVYGLRAGFLFPSHRQNNAVPGGIRAAFKAGLGFYFLNQSLNRPGLLPATSEAVTRRLRIATAFFEPYLYRKNAVEISLPIELGYGHSRYERTNDQSDETLA
jgi:hypothetical protein